MTTVLMGKAGTVPAKARVALVSRLSGPTLSAALGGTGHEWFECSDWATLRGEAAHAPFDLLLCDPHSYEQAPGEVTAPILVLGAQDANARSHPPSLSIAALESCLEPMLALAVALRECQARCRDLERLVDGIRTGTAMVGRSPVVRRLLSAISRAADCDATVLIEGPAGAGKSLTARMIHCKSRRIEKAPVSLDCETLTAESLNRALSEARGTTLLLENVDRLPSGAQAVLVRHLKERTGPTNLAPRLISTTMAHLPELVARGAFREDLYYRLHALPIVVPSLKERIEDLPLLARAILETGSQVAPQRLALTPNALAFLESMPWPGNVAQLESVLRRAQAHTTEGPIDREHLTVQSASNAPGTPRQTTERRQDTASEPITEESILPFEQEEQRMLTRALAATKGNVRRAAQLLGIGRATLYRKIQQYQLRLQ